MRAELQNAVTQLHDIARTLTEKLGEGAIVRDIREIADRISQLDKPVLVSEKNQVV